MYNYGCVHVVFMLPVCEFRDTSSCHMCSNEGIDEVGGVLIRVGQQRGG